MRKVKIYIYEHALEEIYTRDGYPNCIPFCRPGVERWCELVGPEDAELFYGGQYNKATRWLLHPNRFQFFKGNEARHVFDLEGDHSFEIPDLVQPCILSAMNALLTHRSGWNVMVRPACSRFLMALIRRGKGVTYVPPQKTGYFFKGQRDPHGLREKVKEALEVSGVPYRWEWTEGWNAQTSADQPVVQSYEAGLLEWSWPLCPGGTANMMTVRFYEACGLGRMPFAISYNDWCGMDDTTDATVPMEWASPTKSLDELADWLRLCFERYSPAYEQERFNRQVRRYFEDCIMHYFADPTRYLLDWAARRGLF